MKLFVIIAIAVAFTRAAPMTELQHPSPINPNVLVELKPEEKITLITDRKEVAKFNTETERPLYVTVLPPEKIHRRNKRDHEIKSPIKAKTLQTLHKPQHFKKPSGKKRSRREIQPVGEYQKPQILPAVLSATEETASQNLRSNSKSSIENQHKQYIENVTSEEHHKQRKRDILVPLVPKYHHPKESPKDSKKQLDECKTEDNKINHDHKIQAQPKDQTIPVMSREITEIKGQHKRDMPVPLVPKHHHPEEFPKDRNENESHKGTDLKEVSVHRNDEGIRKPSEQTQHKRDFPPTLSPEHYHSEKSSKDSIQKEPYGNKKGMNRENDHNLPQLPSHSREHVTPEGFQKSLTLTTVLKESAANIEHKHDFLVPLVSKHLHSEESRKDSNEEESHEDRNKVNSEISPQSSAAHNYVAQEGLQKHQTLPVISKESFGEIQQHKRDIPVPLVPKRHHSEESINNTNKKESHDKKGEISSEKNHDQLNPSLPQTLPIIMSVASDNDQKHKRDTPVSVISNYQQQEGSSKDIGHRESNDKKEDNLNMHHSPHILQTLSADNHERATTEDPHKIQILPTQNHHNFQQPKIKPANRDVSIPIIHKFQATEYHHLHQ